MAILRVLLGLCAAAALGTAPSSAQNVPLEYAVKANFLTKFGPFIEWPATAFASPGAPFGICVVGPDPFGASLDDAARGQRVAGHPITVRRLPIMAPDAACHIVFVSGDAAATLRAAALRPVLTVADDRPGTEAAMIRFVVTGNRVRFTIDAAAADTAGIVVSSKLRSLALTQAIR